MAINKADKPATVFANVLLLLFHPIAIILHRFHVTMNDRSGAIASIYDEYPQHFFDQYFFFLSNALGLFLHSNNMLNLNDIRLISYKNIFWGKNIVPQVFNCSNSIFQEQLT